MQVEKNNLSEEIDERFETWWREEGSSSEGLRLDDVETFVKNKTRVAWMNGAYVAVEFEKNNLEKEGK
ncbi:MAG: hypothetical protein DRG78_02810 [Epsilonproteobacteria bacterium]|nr:MAG: hypothetical protein DRG78_02810 [Campylobacterota bacterium]